MAHEQNRQARVCGSHTPAQPARQQCGATSSVDTHDGGCPDIASWNACRCLPRSGQGNKPQSACAARWLWGCERGRPLWAARHAACATPDEAGMLPYARRLYPAAAGGRWAATDKPEHVGGGGGSTHLQDVLEQPSQQIHGAALGHRVQGLGVVAQLRQAASRLNAHVSALV